jgi:UDPglucose--hexose-1-phosphate uridylyltransferase
MSELRQDLVSGDWVIIAPGREARPHFLDEKKPARKPSLKSACPFEDLAASGNQPVTLYPKNAATWKIAVIANKYPALTQDDRYAALIRHGMYEMRKGSGEHFLIIGRDHSKNFADLDLNSAEGIFRAMQERYRVAVDDASVKYAVTFFNWGPAAGASIWHPHYQFIAIPGIPSHIAHSLRNEETYAKKHRECLRCTIVRFERKEKSRVIHENADAIAIAPYASKYRFEIDVIPKKHTSSFEKTLPALLRSVAGLLQETLRLIKKRLNDPDLNFFIHSAPVDGKPHAYHHWHIEVICRMPPPPAGFEFSTGIYINTVEPEKASAILRGRSGGKA